MCPVSFFRLAQRLSPCLTAATIYEEAVPMLMKSSLKAAEKCAPRMVGEGVKFERIRRITGYLVGTLDRFNDAKRAEEADRVKHM